jgi:spoIIIJ-associated protein
VRVEAHGESVAEAKWNALRELGLLAPGFDSTAVEFEVVAQGARGLLGVGFEPARVAASIPDPPRAEHPSHSQPLESDDARRLRELLEAVTVALGVRCRIEISESAERLCGTCHGEDLGRLIGTRGQTIDALELLAAAILRDPEAKRQVVVDAGGHRANRRARLEERALLCAEEVRASGRPVELEPMSAAERKLVHCVLELEPGVLTSSEGAEPHRRVVVAPA